MVPDGIAMKISTLATSLFLFGLYTAALNGCARNVVATVNGEAILQSTFEQAVRIEAMNYDPVLLHDGKRVAAMKTRVLDTLVNNTLLSQEAVRADIRPTEEELAEVYNQFKGRYTEEAFQKMLSLKGISYDVWKMLRRQQYLIERLAEQRETKGKAITAAAIEQYYRDHHDEFVEPESVHVRQLVTDKESTAKTLREKILKGANFAQLAMEYSLTPDGKNGGDLGYIPKGTFPAVFDQVCFRLPTGAMSDVVQSEYGYHLFKVLDRRPGRVISLNDARPQIEAALRHEATEQGYHDWVETLRHQAKITIHKDRVADVTVKELPNEK